jgi:DNA-binding NtrC family response regulator
MVGNILVVDDELDMLALLRRSLAPDLDCHVDTASSAETALEMIENESYDLILVDIKMPGMSGLKLLEIMKQKRPDLTAVMMTAYGHIDMAVEAMKFGAYDFITKPFEHDTLIIRLQKALERSRLLKENFRLQRECMAGETFQNLVGKSPKMQRVYETIQMVSKTDLTVLITGESGTGKDIAARAVHALSDRSKRPFVAVNCPTVPENILESELFGYRKGAFTHAMQNRKGMFQAAQTGTIFLDEIGDISPAIQTKLLRVLQEKEIKPLGDSQTIKVDVRIVASTNQHLEEKIRRGEFREDFFYRLNVLPIKMPALREHPEDIPLIANHLLEKHSRKLKKPLRKLSPELINVFRSMTWEGNVREMENLIIQGILFSSSDEIKLREIDIKGTIQAGSMATHDFRGLSYKEAKEQTLKNFNDAYIGNLLKKSDGNVTQAAKQCGMERQTLQQIMRRYGIRGSEFRNDPNGDQAP